MKTYNMTNQREVANAGVAEVVKYYTSRDDVKQVLNRQEDSKDRVNQLAIIKNNSSKVTIMDVKTDTQYRTGNFFIEEISQMEKQVKGWLTESTAEYIAYYFLGHNVMYLIPLKSLRAWAEKRLDRYEPRLARNHGYHTLGRIVPRDTLFNELGDVEEIFLK